MNHLTNPFENIPENLNPDAGKFLAEQGVDEEELKRAGLKPQQAQTEEIPADISNEDVPNLSATEAQKEAWLDGVEEIVSGILLVRREKLVLDGYLKQINKGLPAEDQWTYEDKVGEGESNGEIRIKDGHVYFLDLNNTPIQSLDDIDKLVNLQRLLLYYTPLSRDPAKMAELRAKLPNTEILPAA